MSTFLAKWVDLFVKFNWQYTFTSTQLAPNVGNFENVADNIYIEWEHTHTHIYIVQFISNIDFQVGYKISKSS